MKLNKTEQKLMNKFGTSSECFGSVSTEGKRENNAARSLEKKNLVKFTNQSEYILPHRSNIRRYDGSYKGYWNICGYIEKI